MTLTINQIRIIRVIQRVTQNKIVNIVRRPACVKYEKCWTKDLDFQSKSNDAFEFKLESSVLIETIEEKWGKEEGNNNVIGTGKVRAHEGMCSC